MQIALTALKLSDIISNTDIVKQLYCWRSLCGLSESKLADMSALNLYSVLKHSVNNVPYYKPYKIHEQANPFEWLKSFPIIQKDDIKDNLDNLIVEERKQLIKYSSSGSSGVQGSVYMSRNEQSIIRAIMLLWWEWSGYYLGKSTIQTGITPDRGLLKTIKDFVLKTRYVSAFNISDEEILSILSDIKNKKKLHFAGYPSSLNVFADVALKNSVNNVKFDSAICWGDKLFDHYRKNIREAFGCNVVEVYSCNEGFLVGAKKDLDYFYIMSPHVYVEIVDKEGNPVPDGEMGYVLLTRLDGYSMPLIRYYVGDLAIKLPREKYPEKREMGFPLLERVIGRDTDIVITKSGKNLIVHFFTGIFEFIPEILQFRVIQRDISGIEIEYIPNTDFTIAVLEKLEKIFNDKLHEKLYVTWRKVDFIPPTASGKPQLIQSFIAKA